MIKFVTPRTRDYTAHTAELSWITLNPILMDAIYSKSFVKIRKWYH